MGSSPRYARSPLTEALIDLRCAVDPPPALHVLAGVQASVQERYPTRKDRVLMQGRFTAGEQVGAEATQHIIGYAFMNDDGRQVFQARVDGFSFSRLAPYECWETFRDEARQLWDVYRAAVDFRGIARVAVRYINRLDLPLPFDDFKDYLRTVPEVSSDLPQELSGYLLRLAIPLDDIEATLLLNQASVPPKREGVASIILDIDIFRQYESPIDDEQAWSFLETLRRRKNDVFEACITQRARELIS